MRGRPFDASIPLQMPFDFTDSLHLAASDRQSISGDTQNSVFGNSTFVARVFPQFRGHHSGWRKYVM